VGERFSALVQTGSGAYPASYTMGTGFFLGVKRPGRGADQPPHLAPRLKKQYSYTSTPLWAFVARFRVNFSTSLQRRNEKSKRLNESRPANTNFIGVRILLGIYPSVLSHS